MSKLNITKGKWEVVENSWSDTSIVIDLNTVLNISIYEDATEENQEELESEMNANIELIADSGNTYNKCGILPSDLLWQRDDAIKALKNIIEMNYQNALDQYGDRNKAKSWSCVVVAEECLNRIENL